MKTCERAQTSRRMGERTMRTVRRIVDRVWDPDLLQLETLWADAATPRGRRPRMRR